MKLSWKRLAADGVRRITAGGARHDAPRPVPGGALVHRLQGPLGAGLVLTDRRGRLIQPLVLGAGEFGPAAPLPGGSTALYAYRAGPEARWGIRSLRIPEGASEGQDLDLVGEGVDLRDPAAHPDGVHFVYASDEGSPGTSHLWEASPVRQEKRPLTVGGERADDQPALSPSGRFVAFRGRAEGATDLYLLDLENLQTRRLTAASGESGEPCFVDEYRIVFSRTLPSGDRGLLLLDTLRGKEKWITGVLARPGQPAACWSARGRVRLFFVQEGPGGPDVYQARLAGARGDP